MNNKSKKMFRRSAIAVAVSLIAVSGAMAQTSSSVSGVISNAGNGSFLPGAVVALQGTKHRAVAGKDGRYRLFGVAPGNYTMTVSYVGFEDFEVDVIVTESGETIMQSAALAAALGEIEEVAVQGYLFGNSKSLNDQKEAANIKKVISEEQIASFPDLNTADVLSRVSGVSIQRSNGEGRFISMRGTAPRMTAITINGEQVAFSNGDNRSVELDVVSAAQLSGIEVSKVITPDMDATAIGGSVDLKTRGAFDYNERRIAFDAGVGQNSIADGEDYRMSGSYSDVFGAEENIGVSFGTNFARTNTEEHGVESRWEEQEDVDGNVLPYAFREASALYSKNIRDRFGVNGRIDFKPSDDTYLYASGMYNLREDDQDRQILRHRFDRGDYLSATAVEDARAVMGLHDRLEKQLINSFSLGGEHFFEDVKADFLVSHSKAYTKKDTGQLKPEFQIRGIDYLFTDLTGEKPQWEITNDQDLTVGDSYEFDVLDLKYEDTTSEIDTARLDLSKPFAIASSDSGEIKFGAKYSRHHKIRADVRTQYKWDGDDDLTLSPFISSSSDYMLENGYSAGPVVDRDAFRSFWKQNLGSFEAAGRDDVNLGEPYDSKENVTSVYAMTTQEFGNLLVLAGVRGEFREFDNEATHLTLETNEDEGTDNVVVENQLISSKRSYEHFFPNLQFRYRLGEDTNIRAAFSKGLALPDFFDAMPYQMTAIEIEDGEREGQILRGNPGLDPTISENFDLLGEHFFQGIGVLSGGLFYKKISNFSYLANYDEVGGIYDGFEVEQYQNGAGANLFGVELDWQQQFTFLPGWLSGFGVYANYTYTDASSIDLAPDSERDTLAALPEQMQHVGNLALTYENDMILSKLSMNYSGEWIREVGENADEDIWVGEQVTLDFSFTYRFINGLDVYFQGNNLTDERSLRYFGVPDRSNQHALTGRTFTLGSRYAF